jgi:hypothetical protein
MSNEDKPFPDSKKKTLKTVSSASPVDEKAELIRAVRYFNWKKRDYQFSQAERLEAEDRSFDAYEKLLSLCDGDTDLVQRLLHGKSKTQVNREYREQKEREEKERNERVQ